MRRHPERIRTTTEKAELSPLAVRCVDDLLLLLVIGAILICRVGQSHITYAPTFLCHYNARREREDQQTAMSIDPKGCFPIYLLGFRWPLPAAISVSDHSTLSARDSSCRHGGPPAPCHAMAPCRYVFPSSRWTAACCCSAALLLCCTARHAHSSFVSSSAPRFYVLAR